MCHLLRVNLFYEHFFKKYNKVYNTFFYKKVVLNIIYNINFYSFILVTSFKV